MWMGPPELGFCSKLALPPTTENHLGSRQGKQWLAVHLIWTGEGPCQALKASASNFQTLSSCQCSSVSCHKDVHIHCAYVTNFWFWNDLISLPGLGQACRSSWWLSRRGWGNLKDQRSARSKNWRIGSGWDLKRCGFLQLLQTLVVVHKILLGWQDKL